MTALEETIRASSVIVHPGRYAYVKAGSAPDIPVFMLSRDADEITAVVREADMGAVTALECTAWFRLLEIKVSQPFVAKGFLARVTGAVAARDLNILVVSTYSKDYALVRDETWESAVAALRSAGFPIVMKD